MKQIYLQDPSGLDVYSQNNGFDVRTFNLDRGRIGIEQFTPGWKPHLDEPGFNGDDDTWMFSNHGKSIFTTNPSIMTVGCSITSGIGIPRPLSWPYIVALITGKTVNNCSRSASGIAYQVHAAIAMIREFGKPSVIYALFPDAYRGFVIQHSKQYGNSRFIQKHLLWSSLIGAYVAPEEAVAIYNEPPPDGSKKYKVYTYQDFQGMRYTVPSEWCIQQNLEALHMFSAFCELSDIDLKFCSWSSPMNKQISALNIPGFHKPVNQYDTSRSTNYVYNKITDFNFSDPMEWAVPEDTSCGHFPCSEDQARIWALGVDNYHPGLHSHIHFAEHFLGCQIPQSLIEQLSQS